MVDKIDDGNAAPRVHDHFPFKYSLDVDDHGVRVLWVQSRLAALGLYSGALNGRYQREMSLAIRDFQALSNLRITGVVDRKTWEALCLLES